MLAAGAAGDGEVSEALALIKRLVDERRVRLSDHGFERLLKHDIEYEEIILGVNEAVVIEDYPDYIHGPSVLVLQSDAAARPVHVLWGLPSGSLDAAVVVTAYRPDDRWDQSKTRRVKS
jgi:Domain of unknown function (DUF4258)